MSSASVLETFFISSLGQAQSRASREGGLVTGSRALVLPGKDPGLSVCSLTLTVSVL